MFTFAGFQSEAIHLADSSKSRVFVSY